MRQNGNFLTIRTMVALGCLAVPFSQSNAHADVMKIAIVDMQRALLSVDLGRSAKIQLDKELNAKKKDLEKKEGLLKKDADELKKQALVINAEDRAERQGDLQKRYLKLQEETQRSQMELQQKERELTQPIIDRLKAIVSEMGKKRSATILEKTAVLYASEKDDLTNELIAAFNEEAKSRKPKTS